MKISVVIPCFNVESYIVECLESVFRQTYRDLEIICVNDGSTDQTGCILNQMKPVSPFPIRIASQKNKGQCEARNRGIKCSSGEYIHFLDADDLMLPEKIEHVIKAIKQNKKKPDFIIGNFIQRKTDGSEWKMKIDNRSPWHGILGGNLGRTSTFTVKKSSLNEIGGWDSAKKTSVDMELAFTMLKNQYLFLMTNHMDVIVRERKSGSITKTDIEGNIIRIIELRVRIKLYLQKKKMLTDELESVYHQTCFTNIRWLYNYNPEKSLELFQKLIPADFEPEFGSATTKKYIYAYKMFGYTNAQKLWEVYNSLKKNAVFEGNSS